MPDLTNGPLCAGCMRANAEFSVDMVTMCTCSELEPPFLLCTWCMAIVKSGNGRCEFCELPIMYLSTERF